MIYRCSCLLRLVLQEGGGGTVSSKLVRSGHLPVGTLAEACIGTYVHTSIRVVHMHT